MTIDYLLGKYVYVENPILHDPRYKRLRKKKTLRDGKLTSGGVVYYDVTIPILKDGKNDWNVDGSTTYVVVSLDHDKKYCTIGYPKSAARISIPVEYVRPQIMNLSDKIDYIATHMTCVQCKMLNIRSKLIKIENDLVCDGQTHKYGYLIDNGNVWIHMHRKGKVFTFDPRFKMCKLQYATGGKKDEPLNHIDDLEKFVERMDKLTWAD